MKKFLLSLTLLLTIIAMIPTAAVCAQNPAGEDEGAETVAWFSKGDVFDFRIVECQWGIEETDTTMMAAAVSKVRITVTDSTAAGYSMDYTVHDITSESPENTWLGRFTNSFINKAGAAETSAASLF